MKVSFLVTYYNQCSYVDDSMQSILNIEKPCDWEILVGDDGSDDGTPEKVQRYVDQFPDHIRLFVMERERGKKYDPVARASANRLRLLEYAAGELFCVLDGDDYYCNTSFLKEAIDVFESDREVSVVSFGYQSVRDGVEIGRTILPAGVCGRRVDKKTYLRSFYLHAGACVHKICWGRERLEYIKKIGCFDDNDIVINSLNYGEMYHVGRVIYAYRQFGDSVWNSMGNLERAVLNVEGLDVELKLIRDKYRKDIVRRYIGSFHTMFAARKLLEKKLSTEKYLQYKTVFHNLKDSIGYQIMTYDSLSMREKRQIVWIDIQYWSYWVTVVPKRWGKLLIHFVKN